MRVRKGYPRAMSYDGFPSSRLDELPLASRVWDAGKNFGLDSRTVVGELFVALKALEAEVIELRGRS